MNLSFYEALTRIPLGVAVTLEFSGPLAVAVAGSRRLRDLLWAVLAAGGVAALALGDTRPGGHPLDRAGIGLALLAGACWAGYILFSKETGRRLEGLDGLAVAMVVAAAALVPVGVVGAGSHLLEPSVLGMGLGVALLSSVVPYSLELVALRRVTPRAFGVLLSLDPAVATLAGLVILGQRVGWVELVALALVVAANLGSMGAGDR
ncbi:MAG: EamA family transporter, partial [Acidimicrobiales bacterium]